MSRLLSVAAAAAAILGAFAAPAGAQGTSNAMPGAANSVMNRISAPDVAAMMAEIGVAAQGIAAEGTTIVIAETPGGGRFLFNFLACQDQAQALNCGNVLVMAALPAAGMTYEDLNAFNGNAVVTTGVYAPEQQIVLFGRNIIVYGGHSRDLFKSTIYFFLNDVSTFAQTAGGSASSVAFAPKASGSKISGVQSAPVSESSKAFFGLTDISQVVSTAIANTNDVSFKVDYTPAQ